MVWAHYHTCLPPPYPSASTGYLPRFAITSGKGDRESRKAIEKWGLRHQEDILQLCLEQRIHSSTRSHFTSYMSPLMPTSLARVLTCLSVSENDPGMVHLKPAGRTSSVNPLGSCAAAWSWHNWHSLYALSVACEEHAVDKCPHGFLCRGGCGGSVGHAQTRGASGSSLLRSLGRQSLWLLISPSRCGQQVVQVLGLRK